MTDTAFKVKYYTDPGHGWGAVKRRVLDELGLAGKITAFSYQRGATVYLEEDRDFPLLIDTLRARGVPVKVTRRDIDNRSPIRSYDRFKV